MSNQVFTCHVLIDVHGFPHVTIVHYLSPSSWHFLGLSSSYLPLKDAGSQYIIIYIIYTSFTKFINHNLYVYVFETFLCIVVLCQGEDNNILILDNDDQHTTCVFASKDTQFR